MRLAGLVAVFLATGASADVRAPEQIVIGERLSTRITQRPTAFEAVMDIRGLLGRLGEADGFDVAAVPAIIALDVAKERAWLVQAVLRVDLDWDGVVTQAEAESAVSSGNPAAIFVPFQFDDVDTDADGRLTVSEARNWAAGRITESAYEEVREMALWDLDDDGVVTPSEVDAVVWNAHAKQSEGTK